MFFDLLTTIFTNFWFLVIFVLINVIILWHYLGLLSNILSAPASCKERFVLVTGCDRGFGHRVALDLSVSRCTVLAGCLTKEGIKKLTDNPTFKGVAFEMDVTSDEHIQNAVKLVEEKTRENDGLWAVVNNAGILSSGLIDWQSTDEMKRVMEVNFWGTVKVAKAMLPFVKQKRGRIVNVSSMAGRVLFGYSTAYSCSKFAVEVFTDGLRYEMKPFGITCCLIEPGMVATEILKISTIRETFEKLWNKQSSETKKEYGDEFLPELSNRYEEMIGKLASHDINKVTSKISHAVLSSNPKERYVIGCDAYTIWMAIAVLPTAIGDFIGRLLSPALIPGSMRKKNK